MMMGRCAEPAEELVLPLSPVACLGCAEELGTDLEGLDADLFSTAILEGCGSGWGLGATTPEMYGKIDKPEELMGEAPPKGKTPSILRLLWFMLMYRL